MAGPAQAVVSGLLDGLSIRRELDVPLGPRTWYGVGGRARVLAHPSGVAQLAALVARCHERGAAIYVLGSGANLLVADEGVDGVVVQLDDPAFAQLKIAGRVVTAGAGFDLFKLVLATAKAGLAGLERVAGVPASVGGAIRMNSGGAFGDIGSSVRRVQVMSRSGQVYTRDRDELVFSYRRTNIVAPFVLDAEFELVEQDPEQVMHRVKEIFVFKKNTQPMAEKSAGCAFKNPVPGSTMPAGDRLPEAGRLIDAAGLKGFQIGGAQVSERHANFIFTHDGCMARDVLAVMEHVQHVVRQRSGIDLEREVVVWP